MHTGVLSQEKTRFASCDLIDKVEQAYSDDGVVFEELKDACDDEHCDVNVEDVSGDLVRRENGSGKDEDDSVGVCKCETE